MKWGHFLKDEPNHIIKCKGQIWSMRSVALDAKSAECLVRVGCSSVYCGGGMFFYHR